MVVRTPWTGDQPNSKAFTYTGQHKHRKTWTDVHALSGIQTHDPSVRAADDSTCLRLHSHCDRQNHNLRYANKSFENMGVTVQKTT
jgi:hypothetical protein